MGHSASHQQLLQHAVPVDLKEEPLARLQRRPLRRWIDDTGAGHALAGGRTQQRRWPVQRQPPRSPSSRQRCAQCIMPVARAPAGWHQRDLPGYGCSCQLAPPRLNYTPSCSCRDRVPSTRRVRPWVRRTRYEAAARCLHALSFAVPLSSVDSAVRVRPHCMPVHKLALLATSCQIS